MTAPAGAFRVPHPSQPDEQRSPNPISPTEYADQRLVSVKWHM